MSLLKTLLGVERCRVSFFDCGVGGIHMIGCNGSEIHTCLPIQRRLSNKNVCCDELLLLMLKFYLSIRFFGPEKIGKQQKR